MLVFHILIILFWYIRWDTVLSFSDMCFAFFLSVFRTVCIWYFLTCYIVDCCSHNFSINMFVFVFLVIWWSYSSNKDWSKRTRTNNRDSMLHDCCIRFSKSSINWSKTVFVQTPHWNGMGRPTFEITSPVWIWVSLVLDSLKLSRLVGTTASSIVAITPWICALPVVSMQTWARGRTILRRTGCSSCTW